jgi:hypothetical protein
MTDPREQVLEMVDEGLLDVNHMLLACLKYMSHDDVRGMAHANEICLDCGDFHACTCGEGGVK